VSSTALSYWVIHHRSKILPIHRILTERCLASVHPFLCLAARPHRSRWSVMSWWQFARYLEEARLGPYNVWSHSRSTISPLSISESDLSSLLHHQRVWSGTSVPDFIVQIVQRFHRWCVDFRLLGSSHLRYFQCGKKRSQISADLSGYIYLHLKKYNFRKTCLLLEAIVFM